MAGLVRTFRLKKRGVFVKDLGSIDEAFRM